MKSKILLVFILSISFLVGCQLTSSTPTPVRSSPWIEEEVFFPFGSNDMFGILTLPTREGPFPAIVIISGSVNLSTGVRSGVADQYQINHARKMVLEGFAVLRYDPPGVGKSTGEPGFQSLENRSEEAIAALHYLQTRDEILSDKIGLWGISQGGWVISKAAADFPRDVAFIIPVSGSGVSVAEQQVHSIESESRDADFAEEDITKAVIFGRLLIDWQLVNPIFKETNLLEVQSLGEGPWTSFMELVYEPGDITPAEGFQQGIEILQSVQDEKWAQFLYLKELYLPQMESIPPEQVEELMAIVGPTLLEDPKDALTRVRCPVLAIFGEVDLLQPSEKSAALYEQYLTEAGNENFKLVVLPGEGHSTFISKPTYWDVLSDWLRNLY